jgi:hypothetical protein
MIRPRMFTICAPMFAICTRMFAIGVECLQFCPLMLAICVRMFALSALQTKTRCDLS